MSRYKNRQMLRVWTAVVVFALLFGISYWIALLPAQAGPAQTSEPFAPPQQDGGDPPIPVSVSSFTPSQVTAGQTVTITVSGAHFLNTSVVNLSTLGALTTTWVDANTLQAALPGTLTAGQYQVSVVDPAAGSAAASASLVVVDPPTATPTQTPTATNTLIPPMSVISSEPAGMLGGQERILSVFGVNFTAQSVIRLIGFGLLETTYLNSGALTAVLPSTLPPGQYLVEVIDPFAGAAVSPNILTVFPPTSTPFPTQEPFTPTPVTPTAVPPTPIPGQPSLVVSNFAADPETLAPGDTVTLSFDVLNQGNRGAVGIAVMVDSGSKFVPANGQASAVVPNLGPGVSYTVSLSLVAALDTPPGPTTIPITITYRDAMNNTYTSKMALSATVISRETMSQVSVSSVTIDPVPAEPGKSVTVTVLVTNSGSDIASQVLLRIAGTDNVLLAGAQGDSIPLGDIEPGASTTAELPMIVSSGAKHGPQAQPLTISYLQKGEVQQVTGSITVDVARVSVPAPVILLESYDTGQDMLRPGERFTLKLTLQNVGKGAADNLLITFGTVETTTGSGDNNNNDGSGGNGSGDGSGSGSTTTPSTTFAPVDAGGTLYMGALDADGGELTIEQDFIVNGSVTSGIYTLPITLRYDKPDGTAAQDTVQATVVVVALPHVQVRLSAPLPETVNVGEPLPVALGITNTGTRRVDFTTAVTEVKNGEILDGAEVYIGSVESTDETAVNVTVMPSEEGTVEITISLHYMNDLNQEEALVNTYSVEAVAPPPPPEDIPIDLQPTPEPEPEKSNKDDRVGRFLRGFLGLGS